MGNIKLGKIAVQMIRECLAECRDSRQISAEAARLAAQFGVTKSQIYVRTKDIRAHITTRKTRSDKGRRTADLMTHPGLRFAASLVVAYHADPAESYRQALLEGYEMPITVETFRRYMSEHEITKKQNLPGRTVYRSFQASRPGEIFQFDISGAKQRFYDLKTRRIVTVSGLEVSANHPNENPRRVKVWRFKLLDDYSRRVFTRYYAVNKPNSSHVVDFLLKAYDEMGVPETLYCDNDAVIKYARNAAAAKFIHKALESSGGYRLRHHLPGNARATGKIERSHQESEKSEKLLGLFLARGRELTLEALENFAREKDAEYNNLRHRTTGQPPMQRWHLRPHTVRRLDYQVLRAALLADEYDITIRGNLTFELQGNIFQLPTDQHFQNLYEAQQRTRKKLKIYFSTAADFYTLVDFEGNQYDVAVAEFAPDVAGAYRKTAESKGERHRRELKKFARDHARVEAERDALGIAQKPLLYFDTQKAEKLAAATGNTEKTNGVLPFPAPIVNVTAQIAQALPAGRRNFVAEDRGERLSFPEAVRRYLEQFIEASDGDYDVGIAGCKKFLDTVFHTRDDKISPGEIEAALKNFRDALSRLRAV